MDLLDRMLGHDRWTRGRLLMMSRELSDAELDQELDIGHRTLRRTFHMLGAMERWTGLAVCQPVPWQSTHSSGGAMRTRHARSHVRFESVAPEFVATGRLDETFVDQHDCPQRFGATTLRVVNDNTHPREPVDASFDEGAVAGGRVVEVEATIGHARASLPLVRSLRDDSSSARSDVTGSASSGRAHARSTL
jgi:hypothetical protein